MLVAAQVGAIEAEPKGSNWMSYFPNAKLTSLSIPGTHDSAARQFSDFFTPNSAVITQDLTIREQLDAGVRYLDIRCRHIENRCDVYHGNVYLLIGMNDVLNDVYSFLNDNPSEAVIMSVKQPEHSKPSKEDSGFDATMSKYINSADKRKYWYTKNSIPSLCKGDIDRYEEQKCATGKIVLLRRFNSKSELGIDATNWPDNATGISNSANIYLQDNYDLGSYFSRPDTYPDKLKKITELWNIAKLDGGNYLYLNYTSGVAFNGVGVPRIDIVSSYINPRVSSFFNSNRAGHFGVTVMDFMTQDLAWKIYKTNFMMLSNSDVDNDGISNLSETIQGSDPYTKMHVTGSDPIINIPVNVPLSSYDHDIGFSIDNVVISYKADRLPPGLYINMRTGVLEGTPTKAGKYAVTVMAKTGSGKIISKVWSLFVESQPEVEYGSAFNIKEGSKFNLIAKNRNDSRAIFQVAEGELPPGLTLDSYNGNIKGIPNNINKPEYIVTISASNSAGSYSSNIKFVVN